MKTTLPTTPPFEAFLNVPFYLQKLEETFAQQLEEQERVYGPMTPLALPADLPDLYHDCVRVGVGSVRSSVSSVSEG